MSRSSSPATIRPENYKHSPVHYAVALGDHKTLSKLISSLPKLTDPAQINTESASLAQERVGDQISAVLDRRDNPHRETPLHLAVKLNDAFSSKAIAAAGADISLQNAAGWNALQDALCRRFSDVAAILLQYQHQAAWAKWRRRLPRVIAVLRRMRDFYMEISFHFESSIVPFVGKIAPSDTYKIWKRDGNLRADTSLAGFDGMKVQRADQSFLFFGDGEPNFDICTGSLLVLNRDDRKIFDAFENAGNPLSNADISNFCDQTSVYRPGMDVTQAELVGKTNWRKQEKFESIGEWKARVYEVHNVVFSYKSRKIVTSETDFAGSEQVLPLELDEDDDGYLVAENPPFAAAPDNRRRHSSFIREDRDSVMVVSRKSVDVAFSHAPPSTAARAPPQTKEKEYVKSLRPSVWLTEQFPLKTEELLPLLDILANKVKAVRRMRELLTTKFPPGTFPVKVAIPVVPTVRVVITFTKFVELPPIDQFYTPLSSPTLFSNTSEDEEVADSGNHHASFWSRKSVSARPRKSTSRMSSAGKPPMLSCTVVEPSDPFAIPNDYTWSSFDEKSKKTKKTKSSTSTRKSK